MPAGYLGEFLFSVHVHLNQPQLSQQDWKMLNKWLVGCRLEDLQTLSPAFKQAVRLPLHLHAINCSFSYRMQVLPSYRCNNSMGIACLPWVGGSCNASAQWTKEFLLCTDHAISHLGSRHLLSPAACAALRCKRHMFIHGWHMLCLYMAGMQPVGLCETVPAWITESLCNRFTSIPWHYSCHACCATAAAIIIVQSLFESGPIQTPLWPSQ